MMLQLFFPVLAILFSTFTYIFPDWFVQQKSLIVPCLVLIMFSMGLTLTKQDFSRVMRQPKVIFVGMMLQYSIMPLAAYILARTLNLSPELTAGMILLGATAGGTASNVICYLAAGNVALSVSLTAVSTLISVFLTPFLTWLYLGQSIEVPVVSMLLSILKIVLLPISLGIVLNHYFHDKVKRFEEIFPFIAIFTIVFVIGIIVALNKEHIAQVGGLMLVAVLLHNTIGLSAGYGVSRLIGYDERTARTLAIEVGMQNSGLSVALALKYFGIASALPGAIFSIWHNVSGSLVAAWWRFRDSANKKQG